METITLPELEQAINFWRSRSPAEGEELRLCPEAAALASPYAYLIMTHRREVALADLDPAAREAIAAWRSAHGQGTAG